MAHRAYKFRIYPNEEQKAYLDMNFGATRWLWNQFVEKFNSWTPESERIIYSEKELKDIPENSWLHDCISYALQQKRMDWIEYQKQFFNKKRKVKLGRPKFKAKGKSVDSFRIPAQCLGGIKMFDWLQANKIKLPKITPIKVKVDRLPEGRPLSITISKNKCNQYFISVLVEFTPQTKPTTGKSVGIDLGLKELAVLSDGTVFENPRFYRKSQAKLAKAQRHLSRKTRGSNRYERQRLKVTKSYLKVTNQRQFLHHNLSSFLIENYDHILMEDLNVKGMVKNRKLAKSISDASFSTLVNMIRYKSEWYGRSFHQVNRWFASSKTCSVCNYKMGEMPLSIRNWNCPVCNTSHDRDLNAAKNILYKGLIDLYNFTSDELADYRRGESVRPAVILPKADSVKRLVSFINFDRTT